MTDLVTIRFSNGILCCLSGTQPDNHYLNWCIVHYRIPRFNRVSITWNTETSGAKACTLTHVWRFNPTEMAFLLDAAARPYRCIENQQRRREGGSGAQTCKTLLLDDAAPSQWLWLCQAAGNSSPDPHTPRWHGAVLQAVELTLCKKLDIKSQVWLIYNQIQIQPNIKKQIRALEQNVWVLI